MDVDAITSAIRDVAKGTVGSIRVVTAGKFLEDVHDGTPDDAAWIRGRTGTAGAIQAQVDVRTGVPHRTPWVGSPAANIGVWILPVTVVLRYAVPPLSDLRESERYTIRSLAAEDAVTVSLALTWPGNLVADASSNLTRIVSGVLHPRGEPSVEREDLREGEGLYVIVLPFDAWVQEAQPVTTAAALPLTTESDVTITTEADIEITTEAA